jgi:hypothetical protein
MGGVQTNPPSTYPEAIKRFRERLESLDKYAICDFRLPNDASELPAFEAQVRAFKEAGARCFHVSLTGRELAHILDLVHKNPPKQPLPRTTLTTAASLTRAKNWTCSRGGSDGTTTTKDNTYLNWVIANTKTS